MQIWKCEQMIFFCFFNHLTPNIHIQILPTDPHTFPFNIGWENLWKNQRDFPLVIILVNLMAFPPK